MIIADSDSFSDRKFFGEVRDEFVSEILRFGGKWLILCVMRLFVFGGSSWEDGGVSVVFAVGTRGNSPFRLSAPVCILFEELLILSPYSGL